MATLCVYESPKLQYRRGRSEHPSPANYYMHAHDMCELLYFISGHGTYLVESSAYPLRPGCILIMRPGEVHKLDIVPDMPYERAVFTFHEDLLGTEELSPLLTPFIGRPLGSGNMYLPEELDGDFVSRCVARTERMSTGESAAPALAAGLYTLLSELFAAYLRRQTEETGEAAPTRIREIITYINEHLLEELSLETLCQRFYISKTQLGRLFRAATGSSVWDYILVKRLIEARRRILAGDPATATALACGFRDYSAFYRAYRKRYGVSPAADRSGTYAAF